MADAFASFAKSPPRSVVQAQIVAPPLNPTDVARFVDLLANHLNSDQRAHPADIAELQQLSATIRVSSNNQ